MAKKKALSLVYQWELANKGAEIFHVHADGITVKVFAKKGGKEIFLVSYVDMED